MKLAPSCPIFALYRQASKLQLFWGHFLVIFATPMFIIIDLWLAPYHGKRTSIRDIRNILKVEAHIQRYPHKQKNDNL